MRYLLPILLAAVAGNGVQQWLLRRAWQAEAAAIEACNTRVEASAREASEAARAALTAAHERELAAIRAEAERAQVGVETLRRGIAAIGADRDAKAAELREALASTVDDCAARPVPRSLLDRLLPGA